MEDIEDLEVVEDSGAIEKVKKPHKSKGVPASASQLANLQKGRDARKANFIAKVEEKAKAVIMKKPELVRQVAQSMPLPPPPDDKPKPKKKANKQVIVLQDDSDDSSDDEPQQIIIRRSKKKDKKPKVPQIIQYESDSETSSDDEPPLPPPPPQNKIVFRRNYR